MVSVYEVLGERGCLSDSERAAMALYQEGSVAYAEYNFLTARHMFEESIALENSSGLSSACI